MNLKENYERMFGKMSKFDKLGLKKKLNEGVFNGEYGDYGIEFSVRSAEKVAAVYNDIADYERRGARRRGSNVYQFPTEEMFYDFLEEIENRIHGITDEITSIFYEGREMTYEEWIQKTGLQDFSGR